ncbi:hypothetical protein [Mobiluncus porci]|uniref:4Fe-4S Wbl-type domain-containing protein n=1 Tax=Mobiluncus porci TaxID=2652278 RepID=A0A7K0K0A9_9ACTO|nr:hypothetical protein [Mobiluncus porci]MST48913.1 hypothetical protein [Mobiluncus porci]
MGSENLYPKQPTRAMTAALQALREATTESGKCVGDKEWDEKTDDGRYIESCLECPVAIECLCLGLIFERGIHVSQRFEIFGGLTPAERFEIDITSKHNKTSEKLAMNLKLIEYRKQNLHLKHLLEKRTKEWEETEGLW